MIEPLLRILLCAIGLYGLHMPRRHHTEAQRQTALAKAWRASFTSYLQVDLRGDNVEKARIAMVVAENADAADAFDLARKKGWH